MFVKLAVTKENVMELEVLLMGATRGSTLKIFKYYSFTKYVLK